MPSFPLRQLGYPLSLLLLLAAAAAPLSVAAQNAAPGGAGAPKAPAASAAGYVVLAQSEVPVRITLTGRAVAQNATQLRPRVNGAVTEILFRAGARVEAGTPLFRIDPLTYDLGLASAEADFTGAEADLRSAQTAFDRASQLRQSNTSTVAAYENAENALKRARAAFARAEAALALARAQLDWATPRAPISGILGLPQVSIGDLVTANQAGPLVEIVQTDPIHIDLTEPYATRLRIEARAAKGEIALAEPKLALILDDGRRIEAAGNLVSAQATVSSTTGSRILRFEARNADGIIAPGMFIHAELELGAQQAILVPQRATSRERDGSLTAWVVTEGKAEKRYITEAGNFQSAWIVTAGLRAGEHLLLDGTNNLRDGAPIDAVLATIDAMGVVRDVAAPAGGMSN